jgi:hypothetical protein
MLATTEIAGLRFRPPDAKLRQRDRERIAIASDQRLQQQGPSSENGYRQAFANA